MKKYFIILEGGSGTWNARQVDIETWKSRNFNYSVPTLDVVYSGHAPKVKEHKDIIVRQLRRQVNGEGNPNSQRILRGGYESILDLDTGKWTGDNSTLKKWINEE